jgi:hypothetical protein
MTSVVRVLLWTLVLVAPGGILLVPWLVHRELQRRHAAAQPIPAE